MQTDIILKADLLDIVFDQRNKQYGAYVLRKFYLNRLFRALALSLMLALLFSLSLCFTPQLVNTISCSIPDNRFALPPLPPKPIVPQATVLAKPRHDVAKAPGTATRGLHIKFVDSSKITVVQPADIDPPLIQSPGNNSDDRGKPGNLSDGASGTGTEIRSTVIDKTVPTNSPDIMPSFPGGTPALMKFLRRNLSNPQDIEAGQLVSVKISFVVNYDGTLSAFHTVEDGGAPFNNEVIRVLKKMPHWIPGKTAGTDVSVYYTVPVKFIPEQ